MTAKRRIRPSVRVRKAPPAGGLAKRNTGPASTHEETERMQARMRESATA